MSRASQPDVEAIGDGPVIGEPTTRHEETFTATAFVTIDLATAPRLRKRYGGTYDFVADHVTAVWSRPGGGSWELHRVAAGGPRVLKGDRLSTAELSESWDPGPDAWGEPAPEWLVAWARQQTLPD